MCAWYRKHCFLSWKVASRVLASSRLEFWAKSSEIPQNFFPQLLCRPACPFRVVFTRNGGPTTSSLRTSMTNTPCYTLEEAQRRVHNAHACRVALETGKEAGQHTLASLALQRGSIVLREGACIFQCICAHMEGAKAGDGILNLKRHANTLNHFTNPSSKGKHETPLRGMQLLFTVFILYSMQFLYFQLMFPLRSPMKACW